MQACFSLRKRLRLGFAAASFVFGISLIVFMFSLINTGTQGAMAAPVLPPEGYPKLSLSSMVVTPTVLSSTSGGKLSYKIYIRNTGAYTAEGTTLSDLISPLATYNGDAKSSVKPDPTVSSGLLTWTGPVGFDSTTVISFSVTLAAGYSGVFSNTAFIDNLQIAEPVTVTAKTVVTDDPILKIKKTSTPAYPGANKPLTYKLTVTNQGQPAVDLPITVRDVVPANTTVNKIGPDGVAKSGVITWTRTVNLPLGASSWFTYSVNVGNVVSGTVISNLDYRVSSAETGITAGDPYTVTVINPIFYLTKQITPNPPGSNGQSAYTLTLFNRGSLATGLVITDRVPTNSTYVPGSGGTFSNGVVTWNLAELDSMAHAQFGYKVSIGDIMSVTLANDKYGVCSAENVCKAGVPLSSLITGPTFAVEAYVYPIAKKPGGGGATTNVTPTLVIHNLGPGTALGATALLQFGRISISKPGDLQVTPPGGNIVSGGTCTILSTKCVAYRWTGNITAGGTITITSPNQSTIGGVEGNTYTATVTISDQLGGLPTEPITATAIGRVTHLANLIPDKSAPEIIARNQLLTYNIAVINSGMTSGTANWMTDTVPLSTTLVSAGGGVSSTLNGRTVISWTLPALSTGEILQRSFTVRVGSDLVSGTQILNNDYHTYWIQGTTVYSNTGVPVTTTVREVGLVDSFKEVTPKTQLPGEKRVLTYTLNIVNSSPISLTNVKAYDTLPWQHTTYQRDAVASAGTVISDIVSVDWTGDVPAFSSRVVTFTVQVDEDFEGVITNTAVITHPSLVNDVVVQAVAYITTKPVLQISKTASLKQVELGGELLYTIRVVNYGQPATNLIIQDAIPVGTEFVANSATAGGQYASGVVQWTAPVLNSGQELVLQFKVKVISGMEVVNEEYSAASLEGVTVVGTPVITPIHQTNKFLYLPVILN